MVRHGKNATASSVYSYAERKKDSAQSGYGTLHARLGADSVKPFDCCCLSLQPCREPLISPDGYIFDKESVLKYILHRKDMYAVEVKAYQHHLKILEEKDESKRKALEEEAKKKFAYNDRHLVASTDPESNETVERVVDIPAYDADGLPIAGTAYKSVSNMTPAEAKSHRSFWDPSIAASLKEGTITKPDKTIRNPYTQKPLKYKDLLPVVFTPIDSTLSHAQVEGSRDRYMCPVTRDVLTNSMKCCYLKTSNRVVNAACIDMILKDGSDPINGKKLTKDDIIHMHRGGTGYARTNMLKANLYRPQMALA
uniref:Nitric oxide synthase-interacting protein homolog n=1 Tax=Panagrolaimus sp. PS1159 TaxID=55785 RepID=A0AC35FLZ1_9BILA